MNRRWLFILLAGILILSLAACTGSSSNPTQAPTPEEESHDADVGDDAEMDEEEANDDEMDTDKETVSINAADIYSRSCSGCHGGNREGNNGPPLLPDVLTKDPSVYINTITNGSGPMPSWGSRLSADEISALVDFLLSGAE